MIRWVILLASESPTPPADFAARDPGHGSVATRIADGVAHSLLRTLPAIGCNIEMLAWAALGSESAALDAGQRSLQRQPTFFAHAFRGAIYHTRRDYRLAIAEYEASLRFPLPRWARRGTLTNLAEARIEAQEIRQSHQ